jgi:hypothetical protein
MRLAGTQKSSPSPARTRHTSVDICYRTHSASSARKHKCANMWHYAKAED